MYCSASGSLRFEGRISDTVNSLDKGDERITLLEAKHVLI
jgi:hypothetical protein